MSKRHWQDIAQEAQDYRDASINRVEPAIPAVPKVLPQDRTDIPKHLLSTEEVLITQTAPENLLESIASGKLTSTAVIKAFLRRAGIAQALVNLQSHAVMPELTTLDKLYNGTPSRASIGPSRLS